MIRKLFAVVFFVLSGAVSAQVPVTVTTDLPATLNQAANIAKYTEQITQLKAQLSQAQQTYQSLSGLRDIGGLMNDKLLSQVLPPDYQQAYNALKSGQAGSLSGISGNLNNIAALYQAQNCAQTTTTAIAQADCKRTWQNLSMNQYVGEQGYQQAAQNIQNLQTFVDSIKGSPDAKSLQDLQARIAVEQVKIANENIKLQNVQILKQAQEEMRKQNASDNTSRMLQSGGQIRF
jgi:type IV secretion system protein VirB5